MLSARELRGWAALIREWAEPYSPGSEMRVDMNRLARTISLTAAEMDCVGTSVTVYAPSAQCITCPYATTTKPAPVVLNAQSVTVNHPVQMRCAAWDVPFGDCRKLAGICDAGRRREWAGELRQLSHDLPRPFAGHRATLQKIADEMEGKDA